MLQPYPPHLPQVEVCEACNEGFALDEEYLIAFLGSVLAGSTDPERQTNPRVKRILRRSAKLRARIERAKTEDQTLFGESNLVWTPETERINRVILKNARGHAFFEYGEPMLEAPAHVWAAPLESLTAEQRTEFETIDSGELLPEVGSRMLWRVLTGQDLSDGWVIVQDGIHRYAVVQVGVMRVRTVLFEYSRHRGVLERALSARGGPRGTRPMGPPAGAPHKAQSSKIGATHRHGYAASASSTLNRLPSAARAASI